MQARIASVVWARTYRVLRLSRDKNLLTIAVLLQSTADYPLAFPFCVAVTSIDEIDTRVDRAINDCDRFRFRSRVTKIISPQAKGRDLDPRSSQTTVFHSPYLAVYPASTVTSVPVM